MCECVASEGLQGSLDLVRGTRVEAIVYFFDPFHVGGNLHVLDHVVRRAFKTSLEVRLALIVVSV